jgi:Ca2+-transporting ATPase
MSTTTWHQQSARDVLRELKTTPSGLLDVDAARRQAQYGHNMLPREAPVRWWTIFARQLTSPLVVILFVAGGASAALGEWVDAGVIVAAVVLNAFVGFVQEYKANRALEQLRALVQPQAVVRRDGAERAIPASDVVPGDVLILRLGDQVVADARLLDAVDLEVNEAPLTGESMPVAKNAHVLPPGTVLAERRNMVYTGTSVVAGRGVAVVVATGVQTELGKIASLVRGEAEQQTPLQVELARLARWMALLITSLIVLVFFIGLSKGLPFLEMFETSIALAVAAVPEGLAISVTVVLAIGMQRVLKRKALVRRLVAAETLGSVSVICTDKTGTITEGEMRVRRTVVDGKILDPDQARESHAAEILVRLLEACMLCNDASVSENGDLKKIELQGTPTERALLDAGRQAGLSSHEVRARAPRLAETPFDSARKYMATLHRQGETGRRLLVKGAPERVLGFVKEAWTAEGVVAFTPERKKAWTRRVTELTDNGLRVIAVLERAMPASQDSVSEGDLHDLTLIGLVALQDPLRKTVVQQIQQARVAGVRTVIITGDHPRTAAAIAREAGLPVSENGVVSGEELDRWNDDELARRAASVVVYARVEPRHKIRIVNAWQKTGAVVAMTGDGVNDAPALKAADVGAALGSGTEVAKEASDIVLLDNNLGTITAAIEEGRIIFDNIRKTIAYLLTDSFTEIVLITGALLVGLPLPLTPAQILWMNLVKSGLPNAGLTLEPGEPDIMRIPPRPRREPVMNREMVTLVFIIGVITDAALLLLYMWYLQTTGDVLRARTILFAAVGIDSLLYVFAIKSFRRSLFRINPFSNPWLVAGVAGAFGLMAIAIFVPFFQRLFEIGTLTLSDGVVLLIIGVMKLVAIETTKELFNYRRARAQRS